MSPRTPTTDLTEADFQRQVVELAHILGWRVLHVRRSIGRRGGQQAHQTTTSIKGWPDLLLFHPDRGEHFVAELKSEKGRLRPEQVEVLADLRASGVECHVWRPSNFDEVQARLGG